MTDIAALKDKYFIQASDVQALGAPLPATYDKSLLTPIIDCDDFNKAITAALAGLHIGTASGRFIYIANWWLGLSGGEFVPARILGPDLQVNPGEKTPELPYLLEGPASKNQFLDDLKKRSQEGIDVRVLGWTSVGIMSVPVARRLDGVKSMASVNALTIQSVVDLRTEPTLKKRAILNVIAHARGGVHTKIVIIGNSSEAIAFTGGIDLQMGRWAKMYHAHPYNWHDVVAKVEGPAVLPVYEFFRDMWNENINNSRIRHIRFEGHRIVSHYEGTDPVPDPPATFKASSKGKHHVQSLRTIPQHNYKLVSYTPTPRPCSFAPNGMFEFRYALEKAIRSAKSYIYIEDQSFWSFEVMEWVNFALRSNPQLRVILVTSGSADPNDPRFSDAILCRSINDGLLKHDSVAQESQLISQVGLYRRFNHDQFLGWFSGSQIQVGVNVSRAVTDTPAWDRIEVHQLAALRMEVRGSNGERFKVVGNEPAVVGSPVIVYINNGATTPDSSLLYELVYIPGITMHSKTTLIDDHWAIIGSANIMRRSLYTDFEHSVAVLDEDDVLVRDYRMNLWDEKFEHGIPSDFTSIDESLHAWEPTWGTPGAITGRPVFLEKVPLPLPLPTNPDDLLVGQTLKKYNNWDDPDSRKMW